MEDVYINPNMVIVNLDNTLVGFPLSETGIVSNGTPFESSYNIENHQIVFAIYDLMNRESKELQRFSYIVDNKETDINSLYKQGQLQEFVSYILENHTYR